GILALDFSERFNSTLISFNTVSSLTGGAGGTGRTSSGDGGNVTGFTCTHVNASLLSNLFSGVRGGAGGTPFNPSSQGGAGGDAGAVALFAVPNGSSVHDSVQSVTGGMPGGTVSPRFGRGVGYYFVGNRTIRTRVQVTNGTLASIGNDSLYVDNYTTATTLNTSFPWNKVAVMSAGNLTVQNYLSVKALWPNNITAIWGARIMVRDNGLVSYNQTSPLGVTSWIVVTNRVYMDNPIPTWNTTRASVSYQAYSFANSPRVVNMSLSQTQAFTMVDTTPPSSSALALPPWTAARTFPVHFTSGDGFGVGVANVTLWYRLNGTAWVAYGTTTAILFGMGQFSFTAPADGMYEFATTAIDKAGNAQRPTPPTANDTWTVVDTIPPASHVRVLPQYEISSSFTVGWAPNGGVTDVANYTIQVDTGAGWVNWLVNTTATSATYPATVQGSVAFRTLARDFAGNQETKTGNDTWTIVDTIPPRAIASAPTGNLSATPTAIQITFSEPMNKSAVEAAFSISPYVAGTFTWSNGSTSLRFQPSQSFAVATTYTVILSAGATDVAGNPLAQVDVFTFATPAPPSSGLSLVNLWPWFALIAVALAAVAFFLVRRRGASAPEALAEAPKPSAAAAPPKQEAAIDDVFLLYRKDGVLIKHETRRLRPDIDTDILSGMLTAVQQFVKDSFRGDEDEELNEMTVGQMHILIGRGKWIVLAATLTGGDVESMTTQIQSCVTDMEDHNWDRLEDWDGDMDLAKVLGPYLKKLIRGEYAA
ncbi:MAG TPA: Ig-like domain-containing protein, partial [Thermoplasmata archaeon]|nr:Ig-like domain-containing protein [Thermoplasmata archaeon]